VGVESETTSIGGLEDEAEVSFTESRDDETVSLGDEGGLAPGGFGGMEENGFMGLFFGVDPRVFINTKLYDCQNQRRSS
jgi:hypothetical protein